VSSQLRTLFAGLLVAASGAVLALTGGALGVEEPWPVLLVVGAGLLVGVPRLRHGLALTAGIVIGAMTVWLDVAVLPDVAAGRAIGTATAVLLVTGVTIATRGWLRFGLQLVGWAAMTGLVAAGTTSAPTTVHGASSAAGLIRTAATLLVAAGIGLLLAQVAQLVGSGVRGHRGGPAAVVAIVVATAGLVLGPSTVAEAGPDDPDGTVQHRQTVVRTHGADGTVTGGSVVTWLATSRTGDVTVVLRDQAVDGLRSLSRLGAPVVDGTDVTMTLNEGRTGRSVATLDRELPVDVTVVMTLDGVPVTPAEVVGRSGRLEVSYTVRNRTVEARELRFFDGSGRSRTVTRDVAVPFVGELVVRFDHRFSAVRSDDGRLEDRSAQVADGGTELRVDLVLAAPMGAPERTVVWSADVSDAAVPPVSIRLAPVTLGSTAAGRVDALNAERFADAVRDVTDTGGLVRTGLAALGAGGAMTNRTVNGPDTSVIAMTRAALDVLLGTATGAGAEVNESRAFVLAQDRRVLDGDGSVHGLLDADGVRPRGAWVDADVVYLLELEGQGSDGSPGLPLRLGLAVILMGAVGFLGRAIGELAVTSTGS